ncbi:hypothetical protein SOPP22_04800, partial [Shewanella sp. OPT22]
AGANWVNAGNALPEIKLTVSDGEETGRGADTPGYSDSNDAPTIIVAAEDFVENNANVDDVAARFTTND